MAIYLVTGKLGSGKSLACVGRIRDALLQGRRVATNLDLHLERLLPGHAGAVSCTRVPDKPALDDLVSLGLGCETPDESRNGLIVLDELGAWLNTRSWNDRERQPVIDWLLHSRKLGWDVYFIIQHANMLDKQVRDGLAEFHVVCRRTDRLRIPLVSGIVKALTGREVRPPQVHVASVRYGVDPQALVVDRWWYRARELYGAYDTRQVFTSDRVGCWSYLSPGQLRACALAGAQRRPALKPKLPHVAAVGRLPFDRRIPLLKRLEQAYP